MTVWNHNIYWKFNWIFFILSPWGKTIHRLSVEYNLPRSTLYHRFRNNDNLKQNYRLERKSALENAVKAVLQERLSLKTAADRYNVPKTAIWREVRKCGQYQPSNKELTIERKNAQREILSGKSLTSISAKFGKNNYFNIFLSTLKQKYLRFCFFTCRYTADNASSW